jgi:hypothetical protein
MATEGLAFVLNRSPAAANELAEFCEVGCPNLARPSMWKTQAAVEDLGTPDLAGLDATGTTSVLIEAKFWAPLTDHQPVGYLRQLPADQSALLLFVAPSRRQDSLWNELMQRIRTMTGAAAAETTEGPYRVARIEQQHSLALCSWQQLLEPMAQAVVASADVDSSCDLKQLRGLCEAMDTAEFWPLSAGELDAPVGSRIRQYINIVRSAAADLKASGVASSRAADGTQLHNSYGRTWTGTYLNVAGYTCLLKFSTACWEEFGRTPIWLQVGLKGWPSPPRIEVALGSLLLAGQLVEMRDNWVDVSMTLPIGAERKEVVAAIVERVTVVRDLLAKVPGL